MRRSAMAVVLYVSLVAVRADALASGPDVHLVERGVPQLFVDDFLIERATDLRRTLHQPTKDLGGREAVLALDGEFAPHASTLEANGSIVFDPKLGRYVMFALGFSSQHQRWDRVRLYRFTSPDGVNWDQGADGTAQLVYPRSRAFLYDAGSDAYATSIDVFSCFYDCSDSMYPYKGWQWFSNWGEDREGVYFMQSRDGITWERGSKVIGTKDWHIEQDGFSLFGAGDVTTFSLDRRSGRYLASIKFANRSAIGPGNRQRSRGFLFLDSISDRIDQAGLTRVELVPPARSTGGDAPHDEYYSSTAWRYGSHWLGTLKVWHGGGDYPWSSAGCAFLKLISSSDGIHWKKVPLANNGGVPEVFIPNGREGGNDGRNDGGYVTEFSNPPIRIGNELFFYYGASSWGKNQPNDIRVTGGGIFRARLRPDGFVSVDGGQLVTKPMAIAGDRLMINSSGAVTVSIVDGNHRPLASTELTGDSLEHHVRFGDRELGTYRSKPGIRLEFTVGEGGHLYSFAVIDPDHS